MSEATAGTDAGYHDPGQLDEPTLEEPTTSGQGGPYGGEPDGDPELPAPQLPEESFNPYAGDDYRAEAATMGRSADEASRTADGMMRDAQRRANHDREYGGELSEQTKADLAAAREAQAYAQEMRDAARETAARADLLAKNPRGYTGGREDIGKARVDALNAQAKMWDQFAKDKRNNEQAGNREHCKAQAAKYRAMAEQEARRQQAERAAYAASLRDRAEHNRQQALKAWRARGYRPPGTSRPGQAPTGPGKSRPADDPLRPNDPVNRGTRTGGGKGNSALPESKHGQAGGAGGGGGKGGLPRKRMLGEPRKRRTSGGGGGGFTLFGFTLNFSPKAEIGSNNTVGRGKGRARRPPPQRRTQRTCG